MNPTKIVLYSKPDCHLCEEAKAVLERFSRMYPLAIETVNIENDPQAFELYRYEIPVIFVEGRKLFKYRIDESRLRRVLERSPGGESA